MLDLTFAFAKTLAAIGIGLLGGYGIMAMERLGLITDPLRPEVGNGGCAGGRFARPSPWSGGSGNSPTAAPPF